MSSQWYSSILPQVTTGTTEAGPAMPRFGTSVEIGLGVSSALLGCGYRPPQRPVAYWNDFEQALDQACAGRQQSTVILGDFNFFVFFCFCFE